MQLADIYSLNSLLQVGPWSYFNKTKIINAKQMVEESEECVVLILFPEPQHKPCIAV